MSMSQKNDQVKPFTMRRKFMVLSTFLVMSFFLVCVSRSMILDRESLGLIDFQGKPYEGLSLSFDISLVILMNVFWNIFIIIVIMVSKNQNDEKFLLVAHSIIFLVVLFGPTIRDPYVEEMNGKEFSLETERYINNENFITNSENLQTVDKFIRITDYETIVDGSIFSTEWEGQFDPEDKKWLSQNPKTYLFCRIPFNNYFETFSVNTTRRNFFSDELIVKTIDESVWDECLDRKNLSLEERNHLENYKLLYLVFTTSMPSF